MAMDPKILIHQPSLALVEFNNTEYGTLASRWSSFYWGKHLTQEIPRNPLMHTGEIIHMMYSPLIARAYQPIVDLTSSCPQT